MCLDARTLLRENEDISRAKLVQEINQNLKTIETSVSKFGKSFNQLDVIQIPEYVVSKFLEGLDLRHKANILFVEDSNFSRYDILDNLTSLTITGRIQSKLACSLPSSLHSLTLQINYTYTTWQTMVEKPSQIIIKGLESYSSMHWEDIRNITTKYIRNNEVHFWVVDCLCVDFQGSE